MAGTVEVNERKVTCERCGNEFGCGLGGENCWCMEEEISPELLVQMRREYSDCLCHSCIGEFTSAIRSGGEHE